MKEHPIIFSTPMVRAILDGRKTQTRRALKPQPQWVDRSGLTYSNTGEPIPSGWHYSDRRGSGPFDPKTHAEMHGCPYGRAGDHLWVRETAFPHFPYSRFRDVPPERQCPRFVHYRADEADGDLLGWKPSIHLPRWASRITLEVCSVRAERLQAISQADTLSEMPRADCPEHDFAGGFCVGKCPSQERAQFSGFVELWDSLNASRGYGWESDPFVWVIAFRVLADPARAAG